MRRLSATLATAALLLQPLSAFAFYETPGAVLQAVQFDTSAKILKAELHGSKGTFFISAWVNGMMQGNSYPDARFSANITVDLEDAVSHLKGRFKGSVMLVDAQVFMKVDSIEGTFEDDALLGKVSVAIKQWINIPVDPEAAMQLQDIFMQTTGSPAMADELYTIEHIPYQYGNSYVLTLRPETIDQLGLGDMGSAAAQSMQIKVDTNYKDEVQVTQLTFDTSFDGFTMHGESKMEKMKTQMKVTAPATVVSFDMLLQHLSSIESSSFLDAEDLFPDFPMDMEEGNDDAGTAMPLRDFHPTRSRVRATQQAVVHRVDPGITRPSRRLLRAGGNTNRR